RQGAQGLESRSFRYAHQREGVLGRQPGRLLLRGTQCRRNVSVQSLGGRRGAVAERLPVAVDVVEVAPAILAAALGVDRGVEVGATGGLPAPALTSTVRLLPRQ